jgi:enoyl-CoA hydratase/carnithine racemase
MMPLGTHDMDKFTTITVEQRDAIEIVSLNRPDARNAVNPVMADELIEYFSGLHDRPSARIVILRGNGKEFCAGAELGSDAFIAPGNGRPQRQLVMQQRYSRIIRLMRSCPQPIVALLHGAACGAGFSLLLASDVRFATQAARMNAGYLLPRLIGLSVASELLLTGRFLGADRAKAVGLVSDVVADDKLLETGLAFAAEMARASPMGLRLTKQTLNALIDAPGIDAALMIEDRQQVMLLETSDHQEAVAAFRERRDPTYRDQ